MISYVFVGCSNTGKAIDFDSAQDLIDKGNQMKEEANSMIDEGTAMILEAEMMIQEGEMLIAEYNLIMPDDEGGMAEDYCMMYPEDPSCGGSGMDDPMMYEGGGMAENYDPAVDASAYDPVGATDPCDTPEIGDGCCIGLCDSDPQNDCYDPTECDDPYEELCPPGERKCGDDTCILIGGDDCCPDEKKCTGDYMLPDGTIAPTVSCVDKNDCCSDETKCPGSTPGNPVCVEIAFGTGVVNCCPSEHQCSDGSCGGWGGCCSDEDSCYKDEPDENGYYPLLCVPDGNPCPSGSSP